MRERRLIEQKFEHVRNVIIGLQRFVRAYMKRKTIWLVMLMQELKQEIQTLQEFLKQMKPAEHKKKYEWLLAEVILVQGDDIRVVCRNTI